MKKNFSVSDNKVKKCIEEIIKSSKFINYKYDDFYERAICAFNYTKKQTKENKEYLITLLKNENLYENYIEKWQPYFKNINNNHKLEKISDMSLDNEIGTDVINTVQWKIGFEIPNEFKNKKEINLETVEISNNDEEMLFNSFKIDDGDFKQDSNYKTRNKKFHNNFKNNVLKIIPEKCVITGLSNRIEFCHIKPYSSDKSNNIERQDGFNGIILYCGIHKLFDDGLISFEDDGTLLISDELNTVELKVWKDILIEGKKYNIGNETGGKSKYLKYHRENIFKGGNKK